MSFDLFVVRSSPPITAEEVRAAMDAAAREIDGLGFFSIEPEGLDDCSAYFWKVARVGVSFVLPTEEDAEEEAEPELESPYVEVSSRSGAWPWINYLAIELADRLEAEVYDPQTGETYEYLIAEHTIEELREMHDEDIAARRPSLFVEHWAHFGDRDDAAQLHTVVDAIRSAARDVLGIDITVPVGPKHVNLDYTIDLPSGARLSISSPCFARRSVRIRAPAGEHAMAPFVDAVARRLGLSFRSVEEYG